MTEFLIEIEKWQLKVGVWRNVFRKKTVSLQTQNEK